MKAFNLAATAVVAVLSLGTAAPSHADTKERIGADAGVTVMKASANGAYDSKTRQEPNLGFVFAGKGLIGDLSLEGSKITKLER